MHFKWMAAFVLATLTPALAQAPSAEQIARDLQKKYDGITDFSADFVHSYRGGVLKQQATERRRLMVKKPGKMRWEYSSPERKTFVSDGHKFYSYIPKDRQVIVSDVPSDDKASTPALFLTGKGNISRDFNVAIDKVSESPADSIALRLTPKKREAEYDTMTLVVRPRTFDLLMLITMDAQGGRSAFTFSNFKENPHLSDNVFVFKMPQKVDVINDAGGR